LPTWRSKQATSGALMPKAHSPTFPPSQLKSMGGYTGRLLNLAQFFAAQSTTFGEEEPLQDPFKQLAAVYACVMARARPLAMVPLKLYRSKEVDGEKVYEEIENHPLAQVLYSPNPHTSRYQLIESWEQSICVTGKNFVFLDRAGYTDVPKEMWPLPADRMSPVCDSKGLPTAWKYTPGGTKKPQIYPLHQIIYEKLWDPDNPINGLSPLVSANIVTKSEWAALQFNYFFLMRGCEPGGRYQLEGSPSQDQLISLEREDRDKYQGPHNVGKTRLDFGGAEWKPYPIPQRDMQFQDAREMNLRDIMMAFGVMKINLGLEERFSQSREKKKMFWHNTLIPRVRGIEDSLFNSLTKHIDGGQYELLFDLNSVEALLDDISEKSKTAVELVKGGVPWSEANRLLDLGLEEFEGWDQPYSLKPSAPALPAPEEEAPPEKAAEKAPKGEEIIFEEIDPADAEYNAKWDRDVLTPQEKKFQAKMSRFFMEHRNEVLDNFAKSTKWDGKALPPRSWRIEMEKAGMDLPPMSEYKEEQQVTLSIDALLPDEEDSIATLDKYTRPLYEESLLKGSGARAIGLGTEQQITQITDELSKWIDKMCIDKNMTAVNDTLRDALRETISDGIKQRETLQEIAARIKHIHKNAKNRSLTIARTEVGRAANHGSYEESKESGIVEGHVWITGGFNIRDSHQSQHGQYRDIGQVFSNGLMYPNDPNGSAGETVNCFPGDMAVSATDIEAVFRMPYEGELVSIKTASGFDLTGTPNHPILTERGWVALGLLNEGDKVLCANIGQNILEGQAQVDDSPTPLTEIFDALSGGGMSQRIAMAPFDFYGDGGHGEVDIVWAEGELGNRPITKHHSHFRLEAPHLGLGAELGDGPEPQFLWRGGTPSPSPVRVFGQGLADHGMCADMTLQCGRTTSPGFDASTGQSQSDGGATDPVLEGQGLLRLSNNVFADNITIIRRSKTTSTHVYTLQTSTGLYQTQGILSRNCKCNLRERLSK